MQQLSTFPEPMELPAESPKPGRIVMVRTIGHFTTRSGVVIVDNATHENGPIAVYFNREVPWHFFGIKSAEEDIWMPEPPDVAHYEACPRVVRFTHDDLVVVDSFSTDDLVRRVFGDEWNLLYGPDFPLVPNTHDCHHGQCTSGMQAAHLTIMRVTNNAQLAYCCASCHRMFHDRTLDAEPQFKRPLPGTTNISRRLVAA